MNDAAYEKITLQHLKRVATAPGRPADDGRRHQGRIVITRHPGRFEPIFVSKAPPSEILPPVPRGNPRSSTAPRRPKKFLQKITLFKYPPSNE
jgi:hypothetical protein